MHELHEYGLQREYRNAREKIERPSLPHELRGDDADGPVSRLFFNG
jgi:hypothetical protein